MVLDAAEARARSQCWGSPRSSPRSRRSSPPRPLGNDAARLAAAVRRLEDGDRSARTGVQRADELGRVARALDALTEQLDRLERERTKMEAERRAMLTSISHDLRTPLAALQAAIEALVDGVAPDPPRYLRSMQTRRRCAVGAGRRSVPSHAYRVRPDGADRPITSICPSSSRRRSRRSSRRRPPARSRSAWTRPARYPSTATPRQSAA